MPDYIIIGEKTVLDGKTLFSPGYYSDCCTFGTIFKDEKAFREDRDAICYIPEHAFDDVEPITVNGKEFYDVDGYTRAYLEALITDEEGALLYEDEEGDKLDIDHFFSILLWAYPETYLSEYD